MKRYQIKTVDGQVHDFPRVRKAGWASGGLFYVVEHVVDALTRRTEEVMFAASAIVWLKASLLPEENENQKES